MPYSVSIYYIIKQVRFQAFFPIVFIFLHNTKIDDLLFVFLQTAVDEMFLVSTYIKILICCRLLFCFRFDFESRIALLF